MKTKKFTLRAYLFSILALFLCMNVAQAYTYVSCTVINGQTKHEIIAYVYKGKGYSSFGKAKSVDFSENGLDMRSDDPTNNPWTIAKSKTSKFSSKETYTINAILPEHKSIVSENATCKIQKFDDELRIGDDEDTHPSKIVAFFNANPNFDEIHSLNNPIRIRTVVCESKENPDEYSVILGDGSKKKKRCDHCCAVS